MALLAITATSLFSQVAINTDNAAPDSSAMLDISSTDKGILIPRMTTSERELIPNPAQGLLVFDTETNTFWYFDNDQWNKILNGSRPFSGEDVVEAPAEETNACPELIGQIELGEIPQYVLVDGDYGYVLDQVDNLLYIIDLSDPTDPALVSTLGIGVSAVQVDLALSKIGDYLFFMDDEVDALQVIDVSDPVNPQLVSTLEHFNDLEDLDQADQYLYTIDNGVGSLIRIDVSDPLNPIRKDSIAIDGNAEDLAISNGYAYVIDYITDNLQIIDISSPDTLQLTATITLGEAPKSVVVEGDYAYIAEETGDDLRIINVSDPANPVLEGQIDVGPSPGKITIRNNFVYVVGSVNDNLRFYNVKNPASPYQEGGIEFGGNPIFVVATDTYIYLVDTFDKTLSIIDPVCNQSIENDPLSEGFEASNVFWRNDDDDFGIYNKQKVGIGEIEIGEESEFQMASNRLADGFTAVPWLYTSAIHSINDRGSGSTTVLLGEDGNLSASDEIHFIVNGIQALKLDENGHVGIGTTSPGYLLQVGEDGDGTEARANEWDTFSDRRLKRDFQAIPNPLDKVAALNGYYYHWQADKPDQSRQLGVIAQEVEAILPEIVHTDANGIKSLDYSKLTALLIESNKALQEEMQALKQKRKAMEVTLEQIKAQVIPQNPNK